VSFSCRTVIAAPPEVVFAAALSIDAHLAAMARSHVRAIAGVTTGRIGLGECVTWRARHFGVAWTMTSRITELDEPVRFVDEQQDGPFTRFRHEHLFTAVGDGTQMVDMVSFRAPAGAVGRIAERILLGRYLPRLIRQRNDHLKTSIETPRRR
jgi:ligand-binding SRPBCC domain-containing protein